ncbi:MAG: hypothetical protein KOO66_07435 [Bacteroidales bacterium]|nr:hypothetical protein [Bacteroidales bacterium]
MKIYKLLILIFFISPQLINAQEFSTQDDELIQQKIAGLIKQYYLLSTFEGDNNLLSAIKQKQFIALFTSNNSFHYNDLSDKDSQGKMLTIDQYLFLLKSKYKNSLSVQLELEEMEFQYDRISKKEFQINVKTRKKVVGFQDEGYIHSFEKDLLFIIRFDKSLKTFKIFAVDDKPSNPEIYQPKKDSGKALELYYNLSSVQISHDFPSNIGDYSGTTESNIRFGIIYRANLVKNLNLLTGLQYTSIKSKNVLSDYYFEYSSTDTDGDQYTRIVNSDEIIENHDVSYVDIQLGLQYRIPLSEKVKFNISLSGLYSINMKKKFESNGTFSYQGYYPQYNITLYDLPQYNFASNEELSTSGELDFRSNISILAGLGFEFKITDGMNIQFEGNYQQGFKNISKYENTNYIISDSPSDFNSLMNVSSSTKIQSYGLKIGFVFIL